MFSIIWVFSKNQSGGDNLLKADMLLKWFVLPQLNYEIFHL